MIKSSEFNNDVTNYLANYVYYDDWSRRDNVLFLNCCEGFHAVSTKSTLLPHNLWSSSLQKPLAIPLHPTQENYATNIFSVLIMKSLWIMGILILHKSNTSISSTSNPFSPANYPCHPFRNHRCNPSKSINTIHIILRIQTKTQSHLKRLRS